MSKDRSVGYVAANRDKGQVTVCIHNGEIKRYYHSSLTDTLEALTGRDRSIDRGLKGVAQMTGLGNQWENWLWQIEPCPRCLQRFLHHHRLLNRLKCANCGCVTL